MIHHQDDWSFRILKMCFEEKWDNFLKTLEKTSINKQYIYILKHKQYLNKLNKKTVIITTSNDSENKSFPISILQKKVSLSAYDQDNVTMTDRNLYHVISLLKRL